MKFIFICGGVMSGIGKGVATSSIGKILQEYGYNVTAVKIDPYVNCDAGTMRPTEHGEVWVTEDGGEIDQDLGNYERFMNMDIPKRNNITTGQIYKTVIEKERQGKYLGKTVQIIPHIIDEIKSRLKETAQNKDISIVEIGGTIGDYENVIFLMAAKNLEIELGKENVLYVLISYLPIQESLGEPKTKPTQQAIKHLNEQGIFPDIILCRAKEHLDDVRRKKIETYANIKSEYIVSAPDIKKTIYSIPLNFEKEDLGKKILAKLKLEPKKQPDWSKWEQLVNNIHYPKKRVKVGIVGKYMDIGNYILKDSYISINESLIHAGAQLGVAVDIEWIDSKEFEKDPTAIEKLRDLKGVIVPGGFGESGVEGKISAIRFCRENKIPYLGLCYGMQLAVVEFARNVCGLADAHTTEVNPATENPVIDILEEQKKRLASSMYGGTMRLGGYPAKLRQSKIMNFYAKSSRLESDTVIERHRHRYEVNPKYIDQLQQAGLLFSGSFDCGGTPLMEFIELPDHPFFIATQAHPEFKSRFGDPSPLFLGFVEATTKL
jgi:CTP synthase